MSSLPKEIFSNITNFLPNDDITDLMLMSRNFNALVTPRLKKIDEEMATMNQSIKSFMPTPAPDRKDREWIPQLNLKKFEPIGSKAKQQMKKVIKDQAFIRNCLRNLEDPYVGSTMLSRLKKGMSLERNFLAHFWCSRRKTEIPSRVQCFAQVDRGNLCMVSILFVV